MPYLEGGQQQRILIAGAGIAGLSIALCLHAVGFTDIHIFESATQLTTLGVGINVQPSAVLILRNLGLLPALRSTGIQTEELNYYNLHGDSIISEPRGLSAGYAVPQFSIHRGEFQMLLLSAVKERLGADCVHIDHALERIEQDSQGSPFPGSSPPGTITAHFTSRGGSSTSPSIPSMTGSILIGADGINSSARRLLYPDEGPPCFSGRILWRGCIEQDPYLTGASMVWAGHADQKFVAYPISQRSRDQGRSMINWIAELRVRAKDDRDTTPPKPDWTKSVPKSKFAGPFAKWQCGGLSMAQLIADTDKVYEYPMSDRDPIPRWSFGRLTLAGDAAHACYPVGSNGASQAILDAEALAECLLQASQRNSGGGGSSSSSSSSSSRSSSSRNGTDAVDVEAALAAYQERRLPPTAKIVMANRANGPDQVLQVAHERAPDGFKDIETIIPRDELEDIGRAYKVIAGFEIEKVNEKAAATEDAAERKGLTSPRDWTR